MIGNDAEILQHFVENWTKVLPNYISKIEDMIISRKILPQRLVGRNVAIDIVQKYERTGSGAKIIAKGTPPTGSGSEATDVPYSMYQIMDGFDIHEKDLGLDPKLKERNLEIILKNIHRLENQIAINGSPDYNIKGIVGAALANANGKIGSGDIAGPWNGSGAARDIYNDLLKGVQLLDLDRDAKFLVGNKRDLTWLWAKDDDNREPFWKSVCTLFGKFPTDPIDSWLVPVGSALTAGKVYIAAHDTDVGEIVISENPTLRSIGIQRGGNYPIEMFEWLTIEIHENEGYVEVATS